MAKKKRFAIQEEKRIAQEIELQTHLGKLLRDDRDTQLADIESETDLEKKDDRVRQIEEQYDNYVTEVNNIFAKIDDRRKVSIRVNI